MIDTEYRVISEGRVKPGSDLASVKKQVAGLFKTGPEKIERLFGQGDVTVKSRIPFETADKYRSVLDKAGLACSIEPVGGSNQNDDAEPVTEAEAAESQPAAGETREEGLPRRPAVFELWPCAQRQGLPKEPVDGGGKAGCGKVCRGCGPSVRFSLTVGNCQL